MWKQLISVGFLIYVYLASATLGAQIVVVSSASYQPVVAPGSIASIFGNDFAKGAQAADPSASLPAAIRGVQVSFGGTAAQIYFVSPGQINFLVPRGMTTGSEAGVIVRTEDGLPLNGTVGFSSAAPGIYFSGQNRGAIRNGRTGTLEPFEALDPVYPDHRTRLSLYATGLNGLDRIDAFASTQDSLPVGMTVEYAGPQGQYPGLDQVNVVVPPELEGAGDIEVYLQSGTFSSNRVRVLIRHDNPPTISSISSSHGQPQSEVSLGGDNFAVASGNYFGQAARNLVTFEKEGQVFASVTPHNVSAQEMRFFVPLQPSPSGGHIYGSFQVCVTVDDRKACYPEPFSINQLTTDLTQAGRLTLDFLDAYEQSLLQLPTQGNSSDAIVGATIKSLDDMRLKVIAVQGGQQAIISIIGPQGAQDLLLSRQDLATFDALVRNGRWWKWSSE